MKLIVQVTKGSPRAWWSTKFGLFLTYLFVHAFFVLYAIGKLNQELFKFSSRTYQSTTDKNNNNNGNDDNDGSISSLFDDEHWTEMKDKICPQMKPNPCVGRKLFELARSELNFDDSSLSKEEETNEHVFDEFFRYSPGAAGYTVDGVHHTIYLEIWKGGSAQITRNMENVLGGRGGGSFYLSRLPNERNIYEQMNLLPYQEEPSTKKSVCIVTATRDPISHFLSAYNEIEDRAIRLPRRKKKFIPKAPLLFTRYRHGSTERFRQFVTDFVGGPSRAGFPDVLEIKHAHSMSGILYELNRMNECGAKTLNLTAYLPSLANLSYAFPKFLSDTCPGLPPEASEPFAINFKHMSQRGDPFGFYRAAKQVWKEGENTARSLCALHLLDYACFDSIPIPNICKLMYGEEGFRNEVLAAAAADPDDKCWKHQCRPSETSQ